MKLIFDPSKAKEILLNLDLLMAKVPSKKDELRLKAVRQWYKAWLINSQDEDLMEAWSSSWEKILISGKYAFPIPQTQMKQTSKNSGMIATVSLNDKDYELKDLHFQEVKKKFKGNSLIVQGNRL
jgi:hypothetical protein